MTSTAPMRRLGAAGLDVFPVALGCMGMSGLYGTADETESIATIHAALDHGVTLLDTGDFYGMGHNELLIGKALRDRRNRALLSVKFGAQRGPDGTWLGFDGRPAAVKTFLAYSLKRLGVDHVDIYRPSRLDAKVPSEETVGAIADMIKAGYVRAVGLSEVGAETIRRAHATHPISDLQIEYWLVSRGPEAKIFPVLSELGIGVTAYGLLARGLLTGSRPARADDFRAHLPRFSPERREQNQRLDRCVRRGGVGARRAPGCAGGGLGFGQGSAHRSRHRGAHARPTAGCPGRRRPQACLRRGGQPRSCGSRLGGGEHALRPEPDAYAGQRALLRTRM